MVYFYNQSYPVYFCNEDIIFPLIMERTRNYLNGRQTSKC